MTLQEMLTAAAPRAPDWKAAGRVLAPCRVYEIKTPLRLPGGAHFLGEGRVEIVAVARMPVMLDVPADLVGNYYGSYMGSVKSITLNGNGLADVGLRVGMVANYVFEQVRAINCLDAGAVFSQTQNCKVDTCVFEHNGQAGGPLAGGVRLEDAACTNRFIACQMAQNWGRQLAFCDPRDRIADGASSPTSDSPAGKAGPSQNDFIACMIEEYSGRSRELIYGRAGEANRFDLCDLSHVGTGPVDMVRLTSEDAPLPNPTSGWLFRNCKLQGNGLGYTGIRATGVWGMEVEKAQALHTLEHRLIEDPLPPPGAPSSVVFT